MRMPGGIKPAIGFEPYFVIEDMPGLASGETVFDVFRQGPGRFVAVGKQSFTTLGRHVDGVQHGRFDGVFIVGRVRVKHHFAVGQSSDGFAIFPDVGDQHYPFAGRLFR